MSDPLRRLADLLASEGITVAPDARFIIIGDARFALALRGHARTRLRWRFDFLRECLRRGEAVAPADLAAVAWADVHGIAAASTACTTASAAIRDRRHNAGVGWHAWRTSTAIVSEVWQD